VVSGYWQREQEKLGGNHQDKGKERPMAINEGRHAGAIVIQRLNGPRQFRGVGIKHKIVSRGPSPNKARILTV
jgi:hypothetical protein